MASNLRDPEKQTTGAMQANELGSSAGCEDVATDSRNDKPTSSARPVSAPTRDINDPHLPAGNAILEDFKTVMEKHDTSLLGLAFAQFTLSQQMQTRNRLAEEEKRFGDLLGGRNDGKGRSISLEQLDDSIKHIEEEIKNSRQQRQQSVEILGRMLLGVSADGSSGLSKLTAVDDAPSAVTKVIMPTNTGFSKLDKRLKLVEDTIHKHEETAKNFEKSFEIEREFNVRQKERIRALQEDLDDDHEELRRLRSDFAGLEQDQGSLTSDMPKLTAQITQLKEQIDKHNKTSSEELERFRADHSSQLEVVADQSKADGTELKQHIKVIEKSLNDLKADQSKADGIELKQHIKVIEKSLNDLKVDQSKADGTELKQRIMVIEKSLNDLKADIGNGAKHYDKLQNLESQVEDLKQQNNRSDREPSDWGPGTVDANLSPSAFKGAPMFRLGQVESRLIAMENLLFSVWQRVEKTTSKEQAMRFVRVITDNIPNLAEVKDTLNEIRATERGMIAKLESLEQNVQLLLGKSDKNQRDLEKLQAEQAKVRDRESEEDRSDISRLDISIGELKIQLSEVQEQSNATKENLENLNRIAETEIGEAKGKIEAWDEVFSHIREEIHSFTGHSVNAPTRKRPRPEHT